MAEASPDLSLTFGVFQTATAVAMVLTGIAILQVWNYYRDYSTDPVVVRLLVCGVFVADLLHSVCLIHAVYHYTIASFGKYAALLEIVWSLDTTIPLAGVLAFVVQSYFCMRIYRITTSFLVAGFCWTLALARLIFDSFLAQDVISGGNFAVLQSHKSRVLTLATLFIGAASDVFIAVFICVGLTRARSGFAATDKIVDKLVAYTIGSGALTSVLAVIEAVTFATMDNFVFLAFYCVLPKVFINSLLASLNERTYTRREVAAMRFTSGTSSGSRTVGARVTFEQPSQTTRSDIELGALHDPVSYTFPHRPILRVSDAEKKPEIGSYNSSFLHTHKKGHIVETD
ncbi:hypothetical protein EXIGLDRAFT_774049 [Exidia glandulosa HHB12029]|uniref:DUF6534 domain-containing protein n=1 Tax=Exidia glandulosa HHB12029 TaxID=1314781 RepID=A0A165ZZ92_EXIGL|nr:hypothetical protein EXIGLDRAFT_774049 [Exidia glandulosa HHB12029]